MKKLTNSALLGILAGGILLTGCAPQTTAAFPNEINVSTTEDSQLYQITVRASEQVCVTPDMAQAVFVIATQNQDASVCQQENTQKLDQVLHFLKEQGTTEESIQTSDFSLNPQYDWSGNSRRLIGYEMRTQITISDIPVEQTGKLISNVIAAGASELHSVSYFSSQYEQAYEQALEKAVQAAKQKAETIAHAGGCQVTDILKIEEAKDDQSSRYVEAGLRNAASEGTKTEALSDMAVMPGQMAIKADIEVVFRLLPQ